MYFISKNVSQLLDNWERGDTFCVLLDDESNRWFEDTAFPRATNLEEAFELIRKDSELGERINPQTIAEQALDSATILQHPDYDLEMQLAE